MKIEYYLPEKIITNEDIVEKFPHWDNETFEKKVGIKKRHVVHQDETALDLAVNAANNVFDHFDREKIDFIIFCTQSPDYFLPTTACILQDKLNLSKNCGAFDFNLGCSGYIYGLSIVKGFLSSGIAENILLITSETYSKHIHEKDKTNISIFGDGASATILTQKDLKNIGLFVLKTDGSGYDKLIVKNGGLRNKCNNSANLIEYGNGNYYTDNNLYMNGPDIFTFTIESIPKLVEETLEKNKITKEEIDYFIFHQANAFMLNFLRKTIKIPKEKFCIDIAEIGNTVSSTIPIALKNAIESGKIKKGDTLMLVGFGVGLSTGATIIQI